MRIRRNMNQRNSADSCAPRLYRHVIGDARERQDAMSAARSENTPGQKLFVRRLSATSQNLIT